MDEVISSISKTQLTQLNSTDKTENVPTASSSEVNEDQSVSSITGQPKYDTLELSDEYLEYRTQSESAALEGESEEGDETTSETYNLSLYSESELKDMLSDGKITRSEYNKEIASRKAEDS